MSGAVLSTNERSAGQALALLVALLAAAIAAGCGGGPETSSYRQEVLQERLQKDLDLRSRDSRVLSAEARDRFQGLRYFAVDTTYRFEVPLQRLAVPETVQIAQRTGAPTEQVKVGTVSVPLSGGPYQLAVYRTQQGADTTLWIPFADETTGRQTYSAGRYLDVPPPEGGTVLVDFNKAYNPLCDYNPEKYNCALAPPENRLPVPVPSGEKKSLLHENGPGAQSARS